MATHPCTLWYHEDGPVLRLRVEGWGSMTQSLPLRKFVEERLMDQTRRVLVDLAYCTYFDSTFLGTLLFMRRALLRASGSFCLFSPSSECRCLLQQMGVLTTFEIVADDPALELPWQPLFLESAPKQCFERNVLQAHEELASLPGKAGEKFQAVVRCLQKDLKSET